MHFLNNYNWERSTTGCILSLCLFNLFAEYIIQNARLDVQNEKGEQKENRLTWLPKKLKTLTLG